MQKAVVLGAYGLIGSACCRAFAAAGYAVTGVGRSPETAARVLPGIDWIFADIAKLTPPDWAPILAGADVVVNASGALQDGARDSLDAIHDRAIASLIAALGGSATRLVQISAAGVAPDAPTAFFRSKARGDARIAASALDWVILRPTLVIGAQAYGGTALLRAAAAMPLAQPRVFPDAAVQTVWVEDLAQAVLMAARRDIPSGTIADITESEARSFDETLHCFRTWLGFPHWRATLPIPAPLIRLAGRAADLTGWFGWRAPLRSAALRSLQDGVTGDPATWAGLGGATCRSLDDTLSMIPATVQERWFARLFLLMPLAILTLAVFWLVSGAIGLWQFDAARAILRDRGVSPALSTLAVAMGAFLDIALGAAALFRPWARRACLGMVALSLGYLGASAVAAPDLWADPLGPMVKVLPAILLALVTAAMLEDR